MDFTPIVIEATKFLFNEIGNWIEHVRKRSKKTSSELNKTKFMKNTPNLTQEDFNEILANPIELENYIKATVAETNAHVIKGLVKQIQVHRKNLTDLEMTESEFGPLAPLHIKRGIEREADEIVRKSSALKKLLEKIYGKNIRILDT